MDGDCLPATGVGWLFEGDERRGEAQLGECSPRCTPDGEEPNIVLGAAPSVSDTGLSRQGAGDSQDWSDSGDTERPPLVSPLSATGGHPTTAQTQTETRRRSKGPKRGREVRAAHVRVTHVQTAVSSEGGRGTVRATVCTYDTVRRIERRRGSFRTTSVVRFSLPCRRSTPYLSLPLHSPRPTPPHALSKPALALVPLLLPPKLS